MRFVFFFFTFFASSDSEYKKRLSRARRKNRFFCDATMKKEKTVQKEEHIKSNAKHMQTHVNNAHLRKTTTRRGIISRCGSERIAEEEEEIEKNVKELSSAKSATKVSSAFSTMSLSHTEQRRRNRFVR